MIFGSRRDARLLLHIGRELLHDIVEQEVLYYKPDLRRSKVDDIYGESTSKSYSVPVKVNCMIRRGDQDWNIQDYGSDLTRLTQFAFIRGDLVDLNLLPEVGDIIEWEKNYYEVDGIKENQYFLGKHQDYRVEDQDPDRTHKFGASVSIVCSTHLTRFTKIHIVQENR